MGPLVISRVAALVKRKGDVLKVRLIHDLRRSMVNRLADLPERVVLPRLVDAVASMLRVLRRGATPEEVEAVVLDFADACKQMEVGEDEQRFLAGRCSLKGEEG